MHTAWEANYLSCVESFYTWLLPRLRREYGGLLVSGAAAARNIPDRSDMIILTNLATGNLTLRKLTIVTSDRPTTALLSFKKYQHHHVNTANMLTTSSPGLPLGISFTSMRDMQLAKPQDGSEPFMFLGPRNL